MSDMLQLVAMLSKVCTFCGGRLRGTAGLAFQRKSNPTHGSGWMLQIVSTISHVYENLKSYQRELVDGSDPFYTESLLGLKFLTARIWTYWGTVEERI
jgi:hypothetical protein